MSIHKTIGQGRELSEMCTRGDYSQLEVWRKIQRVGARPGDYRSEAVATFELRHFEETNEVVLLRWVGGEDGEFEIVHSEPVVMSDN